VTRAALAALAISAVACSAVDDTSCTELGCDNGVRVSFLFKERGAYVFEVVVDGQLTTCRATLPLPDPTPTPCDRDGVFLGLSGAKLAADQHAIDGLIIPSTTIKHLTLRVARDGSRIAELDRDVAYEITPGPNGPSCEPKECRSARLTF